MSNAPSAPSDQYAAAVAQLRATAKWLISAFAGLGALLIAGVQITGLGGLSGHRLHMAIAGLVVGLLGVAIAIAAAIRVLTPEAGVPEELLGEGKFKPLRSQVDEHPTLLQSKATSLEGLIDASNAAVVAERNAHNAYRVVAEGAPGYAAAERTYADATAERKDLAVTVGRLQRYGLYLAVRRSFELATAGMFVGAAIAATGAALFAYWANPPAPPPPAAILHQATVRLALSAAGRRELQPAVGVRCDMSRLHALILGGSAAAPVIVVVPHGHCHAAQLTLSADLGHTSGG